MLPYTALHHMLFDGVKEPAFVLTSANAPSEPIVIDNQEALEKLGAIVDLFLFHNRKIAQRCDDSVIRLHNLTPKLIRRSRGYAPSPIHLNQISTVATLGVGAEENVNACILLQNKAFISQHIGTVNQLETLRFLESATRHLLRITRGNIQAIGYDMHPQFITSKLAHTLSQEFHCPVIPVQHHYAHILSLMGEHNIDEMVGIACDGAGYGADGTTWGGEVLFCRRDGFDRLGHLQNQPMIGGDLATKYPLRMLVGMLSQLEISGWILSRSHLFPYGEKEVEIVLKQSVDDRLPLTSSCGRVLDAVAALLGICSERSYTGEPAMKLEAAGIFGKDVLQLVPLIQGNVIDTTHLIHEIFANQTKYSVADLAFSAEAYLARSLAELAIVKARETGVNIVGLSGGVAYNHHITSAIENTVIEAGLRFIEHAHVPPGDGGISFGQALAASDALDS
jgi:hydrogenase maturation protein HypF